jgi:hypothetical protein
MAKEGNFKIFSMLCQTWQQRSQAVIVEMEVRMMRAKRTCDDLV